jgi:thiamine-phosphate pyrophosphorylase
MGPVICMITDGRRTADAEDALVRRIAAAARAGVHLVQIRERGLEGGALTRLTERALAAAHGTSTRVLVNDRYDVAIAAGAHGVHLREESMPAARVRAVAPRGFLIGRSVHTVEDVRLVCREGAVDYLVFGSIFPTASKPGVQPAGLGALADAAAASTRPVLAVGGVTAERVAALAAAGAAGVAAIGLFAGGGDDRMRDLVQRLNAAWPKR